MAPNHPRSSDPPSTEDQHATKRIKSSPSLDREPLFKQTTPPSRSETPAELSNVKVPFTVVHPAMTAASTQKLTKEKQLLNGELIDKAEFHKSPFEARGAHEEGEMDQHYVVLPSEEWLEMKRYNNFIIQGEVYKNDTTVYVRSEATKITDVNTYNDHKFWIARILQVRAKNAQNVFALVAWMYWPEELPGLKGKREPGAQGYHGKFELVASNYMEVLDVLSFAGKADVSQYLEEDDAITSRLYWRQTFCRETQELSKLREHCSCKGHYNPDQPMFICDAEDCALWMHKDCLIDSALHETYTRLIGPIPTSNVNGKSTQPKKKTNKKPLYAGKFSAKMVEANGDGDLLVEIMDLRAGKKRETWRQRAVCLECKTGLSR